MLVSPAGVAPLRFSGVSAPAAGQPGVPAAQRSAAPSPAPGATPVAAVAPVAATETAVAVRAPDKAEAASGLTKEERAKVEALKRRDAEVRAHEQAHAAVGGPYAGAPQYEYEQGPDGRRYAVGGSVSIDVTPISGDPEATIAKMEVVKRAALAPTEPSAADRAVARQADQHLQEARAELLRQRAAGASGAEPASEAAGFPGHGATAHGAAADLARAIAAYAATPAGAAGARPEPVLLRTIA